MRAILTYHSIDRSGSPISCDPDSFERHVQWLRSGGVRVTTVAELVTMPPATDAIAITFDDGFENVGTFAAPRLLDAGLAATIFVVSGHAGGTNAWGGARTAGIPDLPLLGWDALGRLAEQGVQIGSHSRTHPDLTRLSDDALADEVVGSADAIAAKTGMRPTVFAYPYGVLDGRTVAMVAASYPFACTTAFRMLDGATHAAQLPRLDAYYFRKPGAFDAWGTSAFERMVHRRDLLRRVRRAPGRIMRQVLSLGGQ
jgi:peptidoglycan/xylan/chitin deacetylase (PgdA/CDA1 family)